MRQGFESLGRIRLQGLTLLAVTFAVGLLVGMAGERYRASRHTPPRPFPHRVGELPGPYERLDLTTEQRERIAEILAQRRTVTDSLMREVFPRVRAMTDSIRLEINEVLTPEQREKLREEFGEFGFPEFRPGGPSPPGPPGFRPPGGN